MEEIWKEVKNYEGLYWISNKGRVKSKNKILSPNINSTGYYKTNFSKEGKVKTVMIHQLVAIVFKEHIINGHKLVINHKDTVKTNNEESNLEIVSNRKNTNHKHLSSTSKYVGVYWNKQKKKWRAQIYVNGKREYLGQYSDEEKAAKAYQKRLKEVSH